MFLKEDCLKLNLYVGWGATGRDTGAPGGLVTWSLHHYVVYLISALFYVMLHFNKKLTRRGLSLFMAEMENSAII